MSEPHVNASQVRILKLMEVLAGHEITGMHLRDAARLAGESASTTCRDLQAAAAAGWVRRVDDVRYALSPRPIQLLTHFLWALEAAKAQIQETEQRYTATPQ
ncbi:hypothetical protein [Thauera sinica]|uniref:HTH iclR-type domain-containing protein n=1 Tax=Thauera sinica TaxID=2665146 RepID=A0ABW1AXQ5_9RHOO|nr:hypothetical protein [Thauera sp. K11]ATE60146.1 hypothetical protein CCZ27_09470 [Thauera sp. K11]